MHDPWNTSLTAELHGSNTEYDVTSMINSVSICALSQLIFSTIQWKIVRQLLQEDTLRTRSILMTVIAHNTTANGLLLQAGQVNITANCQLISKQLNKHNEVLSRAASINSKLRWIKMINGRLGNEYLHHDSIFEDQSCSPTVNKNKFQINNRKVALNEVKSHISVPAFIKKILKLEVWSSQFEVHVKLSRETISYISLTNASSSLTCVWLEYWPIEQYHWRWHSIVITIYMDMNIRWIANWSFLLVACRAAYKESFKLEIL